MEFALWFGAMLVAFVGGMATEKYRQHQVVTFEETTLRKVKRQMQLLIEELELTGSGIIVEMEQNQGELRRLIEDAERKIAILRLGTNKEGACPDQESRQERIQRMLREGKDVETVAQRTGANQGEVRLILGLLNKKMNKN